MVLVLFILILVFHLDMLVAQQNGAQMVELVVAPRTQIGGQMLLVGLTLLKEVSHNLTMETNLLKFSHKELETSSRHLVVTPLDLLVTLHLADGQPLKKVIRQYPLHTTNKTWVLAQLEQFLDMVLPVVQMRTIN